MDFHSFFLFWKMGFALLKQNSMNIFMTSITVRPIQISGHDLEFLLSKLKFIWNLRPHATAEENNNLQA